MSWLKIFAWFHFSYSLHVAYIVQFDYTQKQQKIQLKERSQRASCCLTVAKELAPLFNQVGKNNDLRVKHQAWTN